MSDEQAKDGGKRDRSPKFPYIGLAKAVERIEVLYNKVKRYDARVMDIAGDWGLSAKSSSTDRTVAALQSFGLIEDSGSGPTRKIKLSDLGARVLGDLRPGVKDSLLAEAALKPPAIAHYAHLWRGGRPDEAHALSQLQFEGQFTPDAAKLFLRVFDETIRFISPLRSDSEDENEMELTRGAFTPYADKPMIAHAIPQAAPPKPRDVKIGIKEDVFSLEEGNAVLQWPSNLSRESFDDLKAWVELVLKKIERSVSASENQTTSVADAELRGSLL